MPTCPKSADHLVKPVRFSSFAYDYCTVCKEDIARLPASADTPTSTPDSDLRTRLRQLPTPEFKAWFEAQLQDQGRVPNWAWHDLMDREGYTVYTS